MREVDFYDLTRAAQDRFIRCVRGVGVPAPWHKSYEFPRELLIWLGASGVAVGGLATLLLHGLGSLSSSVAMHGPAMIAVYALLVATVFFGILRAFAFLRDQRKLPYKVGVYLFPSG